MLVCRWANSNHSTALKSEAKQKVNKEHYDKWIAEYTDLAEDKVPQCVAGK